MNQLHEDNRAQWNALAPRWKELKETMDWDRCHLDPTIRFAPIELETMGDVSGKSACVLASGDNRAVFALVGMGATVTSVDISENQLQVAQERAAQIGLDIRFIRADATSVPQLEDGEFDLVFMGSGAICWFSDLDAVCREATRTLKDGGQLILRDSHPFSALLGEPKTPLNIAFPYFERGPHTTDEGDGIRGHLFHWTIADQFKAITQAGCHVTKIEEWGKAEWDDSPASLVPGAFYIVGEKRSS
ncbi:MAG: methyltransferase domain-containing protein [Candidatus Latescibacteria bacterium]|nr:methyltransferase domain-containing protein [Candidatus Latescibacterota bacterium]